MEQTLKTYSLAPPTAQPWVQHAAPKRNLLTPKKPSSVPTKPLSNQQRSQPLHLDGDGELDQKVQDRVKHCVGYVLSHSDTCPRYLAYSDEILLRAREELRRMVKLPREIQEHVQSDLLYFILLRQLVDVNAQTSQPRAERVDSDAASRNEKRRKFGSSSSRKSDNGSPLWKVLDGIVTKEAKAARESERGGQAAAHKNEGEDECWREFWEHYRAGSAKHTHVEVARDRAVHGGRIATTGAFPTVSGRIMQEFESLMKPPDGKDERKREEIPQAVLAQRGQMRSSDKLLEKERRVSRRGLTKEKKRECGSQSPSSSQGFNQAASSKGYNSSREFSGSDSPSRTPQHTQNRAASRSGEKGYDSKDPKLRQRFSPEARGSPSRGSDSPVKLPAIAPKVRSISGKSNGSGSPVHAGHGPTSKFTGWDDYKLRRGLMECCLDGPTQALVSAASGRPQREVTVALLEHRAAVEWRTCKTVVRDNLGSKQRFLGGALSARSRQIHLPPVAKCHVHEDGSQTDRGHTRTDVRIPPASFRRPWSREERELRWDSQKFHNTTSVERFSAIERYAKICKNTGLLPQAVSVRFLVQLPRKLSVRAAGYSDNDLFAFIASLPRDGSMKLETFDIGENPRLSDAAACMVFEAVSSGVLGPIQVLQLDHCNNFGQKTIKLCTEMLLARNVTESLSELQMLDVSGISIGRQDYLELAKAVQMHRRLRDVRLAETGLGRSDKAHASRVITMLVETAELRALDLSLNMLDATALQMLGTGLADHDRLASLGLSNVGSSWDPVLDGPSILVFLEHLSADTTLTFMNISGNNLGEGGGIVLESACRRHPSLHCIDISSNPLGLNGKRALLRLLASEECPNFTELNCDDCSAPEHYELDLQPFDVDPSGHYYLNLEQPVKRAFLRLLLGRFAEGPGGIPLPKLLHNARYKHSEAEKPFNFNLLQPAENGRWKLPIVGELSFDLNAGEVVIGNAESLAEDLTVADRIEKMARRSRLPLSSGVKTLAVLSQAKRAKKAIELKNVLLAIASDFLLTPEQVQGLCITRVKRLLCNSKFADILCGLLPCLDSAQQIREACYGTRTLNDLFRLHVGCQHLLRLNLENPTGHYDLFLSDPSQLAVMQRLLLLNRWELHVWKAAGLPDISQNGTGKNFRNAKLAGRSWALPQEEWRLPPGERLTFDYVSLRRPPASAEPLRDETFQVMMRVLRDARTADYVTCIQERMLDAEGRSRKSMLDKRDTGVAETPLESQSRSHESSSEMSESWSESDASPVRKPPIAIRPSATGGKLADLALDGMSEQSVVHVIWALSPHFFLLCRQLREMLCAFTSTGVESYVRCEALTFLFSRVIDWPMNLNLCRPKLEDDLWKKFKQRVGYVNAFPFFQPENYFDSLDLSVNEQRRVAHCMTSLCSGEKPQNIRNPRIDLMGPRAAPVWDSLTTGMPSSWSNWDELPKQGVFEATYSCSINDVNLQLRRKLCASIAGYTALPDNEAELSEKLVSWSMLGWVPQDVHHFIYFVVCNFSSLENAFQAIDSNSDGELSLTEFVTGCKSIGFQLPAEDQAAKVEGGLPTLTKLRRSVVQSSRQSKLDEITENLTAVFHFLDPSGDGKVTVCEFLALEGMQQEVKQTMWEFVELFRGKHTSLEIAWDHADIDKSGTMDRNEFEHLVKQWKFDGPAALVFMWINSDGSDSISKEEWMKLDSIQKPVW